MHQLFSLISISNGLADLRLGTSNVVRWFAEGAVLAARRASRRASPATMAHCNQSALNAFEAEREALIAVNRARMLKVRARVGTHSLVFRNVSRQKAKRAQRHPSTMPPCAQELGIQGGAAAPARIEAAARAPRRPMCARQRRIQQYTMP